MEKYRGKADALSQYAHKKFYLLELRNRYSNKKSGFTIFNLCPIFFGDWKDWE